MRRLSDELFARPDRLKIFISSEMQSGTLRRERTVAAEAISSTGIASPWWWERNAHAGPYSAPNVCLGHARTSDGLVLILATRLTEMTRKEYFAANSRGVPCYIMIKNQPNRETSVDQFIRRQQHECITSSFQNLSELKTHVVDALAQQAATAVRHEILRTRQRADRRTQRQRTSSKTSTRRLTG